MCSSHSLIHVSTILRKQYIIKLSFKKKHQTKQVLGNQENQSKYGLHTDKKIGTNNLFDIMYLKFNGKKLWSTSNFK